MCFQSNLWEAPWIHCVSKRWIEADLEKVRAILKIPPLKNISQLQSLQGRISLYEDSLLNLKINVILCSTYFTKTSNSSRMINFNKLFRYSNIISYIHQFWYYQFKGNPYFSTYQLHKHHWGHSWCNKIVKAKKEQCTISIVLWSGMSLITHQLSTHVLCFFPHRNYAITCSLTKQSSLQGYIH